MLRRVEVLGRSLVTGYLAAVSVPIALTLLSARFRLPPFIFEHFVTLLVVAFAIPWGLRVSGIAAVVAVLADDVLLREPFGQPTITGFRDALDLIVFAGMAVVVSGLVAKARRERARAEEAAERERRARDERDRLIATVSHDMATPLAVLSGTLQFMRNAGARSESELARLLVRLETATGRATSLVRTLADAQALDADGFTLTVRAVDLREILAPIAQMLDRVSDRHPVVLAMPDTPVIVQADAERLQRVVENVVSNAIKYSPDGGGVEMCLTVELQQAVIQVRDYGIGISGEALPHVFDRSYRAREAVAVAPGLGLGLNIAAQIVAKHGGAIEARPADGSGTVFAIRIPVSGEIGDRREIAPMKQAAKV